MSWVLPVPTFFVLLLVTLPNGCFDSWCPYSDFDPQKQWEVGQQDI